MKQSREDAGRMAVKLPIGCLEASTSDVELATG
jgi:hypothetical protein